MFKNALVYRLEHWAQPPLSEIEERLQRVRFVGCGASQPESIGWVEPRGEAHGAMLESIGGQLILRLATETKAVPGSVVKSEVQARLDAIEKDTGRRPKGKMVKELKEEVIHALLPRAFPKRSDTLVWLDPKGQWLVVGAGSVKKADELVTGLIELLGGGLKISLVQTALAPATAMAAWLAQKEAPAGFAIDRECELKQPDTEKASVRYSRHTLDIDEVGEHIKQGKLPRQLALTWAGRVSFVLTEALTLKKIELLDIVFEGATAGTKDEGAFDADVALFTGELRLLIADLVEALGGMQQRVPDGAARPAAAPARGEAATQAAPWETTPA